MQENLPRIGLWLFIAVAAGLLLVVALRMIHRRRREFLADQEDTAARADSAAD
jgi:beta-lactamase regulating signal transducer with metallopeptidase domain